MLDGWRINVDYQDIEPPLKIAPFVEELIAFLPDKYAPLTQLGKGNEGYLFALPPKAGRFLFEKIGVAAPDTAKAPSIDHLIEQAITSSNIPDTEKTALVKSRVGQGSFRESLLQYWNGCCCISGMDFIPLLRASHIKPWKDANNKYFRLST